MQHMNQFVPQFHDAHQMSQNLINLLPPLKFRHLQETQIQNDIKESNEKSDLKERNRLAAQKWRLKKDHYLGELENTNDELRQQALDLCNQAHTLRIENKVLEEQLQYFQMFMTKIMNVPHNNNK